MPREPEYRADEHMTGADGVDPYTRPAFALRNRMGRLLWKTTWLLLYRPSPRPMHGWRAMLLRMFGAELGPDCHFYPASRVWAPWNLRCADHVAAADGVEIYNPSPIELGSHVILSQDCYLCGATHDYNDPEFPLLAYAMTIEAHAWICARASVAPGIRVGEGAVLGLGSVATKDLEPWTVYSGHPAQPIRKRLHSESVQSVTETAAP
ncbi:MAG TPA: putative colanic acid biosynthesis acetyltransferase [Acidobacteriaceae bacterium]|jgi:putative colanic acid biosynthesis acetyltransferase WcaF